MKVFDGVSKLTLIKDLGLRIYGTQGKMRRLGLYLCDCGNEKDIVMSDVNRGHTRSCGCLHLEKKPKHGLRHTSIYKVWCGINTRCYNKNVEQYKDYGGRGILICDEWKNPLVFCNWAIENGYKKGLEIDRINNDGNYEPSNCQFITHKENCATGKKRKPRNNTSGFVGVHLNSEYNKWVAQISIGEKRVYIGWFLTINEAVEARIKKEIELFGEQKTNLKVGG